MKKKLLLLLWVSCLPGWANAVPEIVKFHQADSSSYHCCWGVSNLIVGNQGPNDFYTATTWNGSAQASGAVDYGTISGSVSASAQRSGSYAGASGYGRVRDYFVDTFTVLSSTLPVGTPVEVQLGISLQFNTTTQADPGGSARSVAMAVWHFNGPDAPWIAGAVFDRDTEGLGDFIQTRNAQATFASTVGGSFTLVGDLVLEAVAFAADNPSSANATLSGNARYTVAVLTPNAGFSTLSGTTYVTAVPEPSVALMLGVGMLVLLRVKPHRSKATLQPSA
jgi:hypothetical protein